MTQGSPLIHNGVPQHGSSQRADWTPTPEAVVQQQLDNDNSDWEYWHRTLPHAVEFAKVTISPNATADEKQAHLRATLDTMTKWLKS